ncbi:hypothetical protein DFQ28_010802 [Apophysomyces sp. BC1034]|nr:hypothetical protein DFQ28_010802 [Apophysomyces sp. BC1034]
MVQARPTTFIQRVDFPVYGLDFSVDDSLIAVGGGGANRSGVKNRVLPEFVAGINQSIENVKQGNNKNCRVFSNVEGSIAQKVQISTSTNTDPDEYLKVLRYSRSGRFIVSGFTDGKVTVLKYPELIPVSPPLRFNDVQDIDIDFQEENVAVATAKAIIVLSLKDGTIEQVINSPNLNRSTIPGETQKLYAVINPTSRGRGFVCMWNLRPGRQITAKATMFASVSRKSITSFCVSPVGNLLAYASTDLSIGLVDAKTLRPVLHVDRAHGFAITSLKFSRSGKHLASAGADNCCRVMEVPENLELGIDYVTPIYVLLCMLMAALWSHIIVQMAN